MKTLFENEFVKCQFDEENKILRHIWIANAKGDDFRNNLLKILDSYKILKKDNPVLHWLGDTSKLSVMSLTDQKWLDETWNELLFVDAGVKTHAVIVSADAFAKYAMEKFNKTMNQKHADNDVISKTFKDEETAYEWFREYNKKYLPKS